MASNRRVVVTGIGLVSSLGIGTEANWTALAAGGSGNASLVAPAMRRLPIGLPNVLATTVASGDVRPYVGTSDICMIYPVADISGITGSRPLSSPTPPMRSPG